MHDRKLRSGVVVIGDAGRSPRMMRHAVALRSQGHDVDFIALRGKDPSPELEGVRVVLIDDPATLRLLRIGVRLLRLLLTCRYDVVIVQNPPAFPTLPVVLLARCAFILDWHNLTSAMAGLRTQNRFLLAMVRRAEMLLARGAKAHFAVTPQMERHLLAHGFRDVTVVRDLPLQATPRSSAPRTFPSTLRWLNDRPRNGTVLVSPTSWTADEDFDLLLEALQEASGVTLIITGDGKRRALFEPRLAQLPVAVATGWLEERAYRELLRSCDAGLSLHRSASGLDFPMKIADFLGASLPVIALDYGDALREPLEGTEHVLFRNAAELTAVLRTRWFGTQTPPQRLWDEEWESRAAPIVLRAATPC